MDSHEIGRVAEDLAADYLSQLGYTLLERNYRCRCGEIDSIFIDGEFLVFVEVKHIARVGTEALCHQIDRRKRSKIIQTAQNYLFFHPEQNNLLIRFDVLGICVDTMSIKHFKNAFEENALI